MPNLFEHDRGAAHPRHSQSQAPVGGLMQNSRLMDSLREFDSTVVILRRSRRICNNRITDSSSIFRSPQNDNAVFALNHSGSGTHSSARPGRLWGSHLRCEPAPGVRSSLSERERACHNCHVERSGSTNAASAKAACGLCLARRRKTNVVQSRIYFGQGYRFFVALLLRMTNY